MAESPSCVSSFTTSAEAMIDSSEIMPSAMAVGSAVVTFSHGSNIETTITSSKTHRLNVWKVSLLSSSLNTR